METIPEFAVEFKVHIEGAVATVRLNRPEAGNALTRDMMARLAELISSLAARPDINLLVIAANGDEFCRGRDGRGESRKGLSAYEVRMKMMGAVLGVYDAISAAPVPVIACVHGNANGFGAALAGACDMTLASDAAQFRFAEIEDGIPPLMAMTAVMPHLSPKRLAYLIYSAEAISAHEAAACGLASKVFGAAAFAAETRRFIERLAGKPRLTLTTIKRFQDRAASLGATMRSEYAGTLLALVRSSGGA